LRLSAASCCWCCFFGSPGSGRARSDPAPTAAAAGVQPGARQPIPGGAPAAGGGGDSVAVAARSRERARLARTTQQPWRDAAAAATLPAAAPPPPAAAPPPPAAAAEAAGVGQRRPAADGGRGTASGLRHRSSDLAHGVAGSEGCRRCSAAARRPLMEHNQSHEQTNRMVSWCEAAAAASCRRCWGAAPTA